MRYPCLQLPWRADQDALVVTPFAQQSLLLYRCSSGGPKFQACPQSTQARPLVSSGRLRACPLSCSLRPPVTLGTRAQPSSLSATAAEGTEEYDYVSLEKALVPFGEISVLGEVETIEPESEVSFGLLGSLLSTSHHPVAGTYQLRHETEAGGVSKGRVAVTRIATTPGTTRSSTDSQRSGEAIADVPASRRGNRATQTGRRRCLAFRTLG